MEKLHQASKKSRPGAFGILNFLLAWCSFSILNAGIFSSFNCGACQLTLGFDGNGIFIWRSVSSSLGCILCPNLNLFATVWYALTHASLFSSLNASFHAFFLADWISFLNSLSCRLYLSFSAIFSSVSLSFLLILVSIFLYFAVAFLISAILSFHQYIGLLPCSKFLICLDVRLQFFN